MKKYIFVLLTLFLVSPIAINAIDPNVVTLEANSNQATIYYSGTTEGGSVAVMCKLYNSNEEQIDLLSTEVDNNEFSGSFIVSDSDDYTVACANYEGGTIVTSEVTTEVTAQYEVTFETNGGNHIDSVMVTAGQTVEKPEDPTNGDLIFAGWYTDGLFTTPFEFSTPITGSLTLYAKWNNPEPQPIMYTVEFETNGGSAIDSIEVEAGHTINRPEDPTKGDMVFAGWYEDGLFTRPFNFEMVIEDNITLYAKWDQPDDRAHFVVTFESGCEIEPYFADVLDGDRVEQPDDLERDGFIFAGWYADEDFEELFDFNQPITDNISVFAKWDEIKETKSYTIDDEAGNIISFVEEIDHEFTLIMFDVMKLSDEELEDLLNVTREEFEPIMVQIKDLVKNYGTLISFFEIFVEDGTYSVEKGPFDIKIKMTDEMKKYNSFKLINITDEFKTETPIELVQEGDYLKGTLKHLSHYALMGTIEEKEVPNTLDNIGKWIGIFVIALLGIGIVSFLALKQKKSK